MYVAGLASLISATRVMLINVIHRFEIDCEYSSIYCLLTLLYVDCLNCVSLLIIDASATIYIYIYISMVFFQPTLYVLLLFFISVNVFPFLPFLFPTLSLSMVHTEQSIQILFPN